MENKYLSISGQIQEHIIHIESQIANIDNEIKIANIDNEIKMQTDSKERLLRSLEFWKQELSRLKDGNGK